MNQLNVQIGNDNTMVIVSGEMEVIQVVQIGNGNRIINENAENSPLDRSETQKNLIHLVQEMKAGNEAKWPSQVEKAFCMIMNIFENPHLRSCLADKLSVKIHDNHLTGKVVDRRRCKDVIRSWVNQNHGYSSNELGEKLMTIVQEMYRSF